MGAEENKALMLRYYTEIWEKQNMAVSPELVAADLVDHMPMPGQGPGIEAHDQMVLSIASAFPDMHFTIDQLLADGDKVVGQWTMEATHKGPMMGVPATGKHVTMKGIDIARWENGKIAEVWHIEDAMSMLQQIGAIPGGPA